MRVQNRDDPPLALLYGWLMILAVFLAPFLAWRIGRINLNLSDVLFIFAGAILFVRGRAPVAGKLSKLRGSLGLWFMGSGMIIVFLGLSTIASHTSEPSKAVTTLLQYGFAFSLVPLLLVALNEEFLLRCSKAWLISLAIVGMTGGLMALGLVPYHSGFLGHMAKGSRFGSFMENPNTLAKTISVSIPLFFQLQMSTHRLSGVVMPSFVVVGFVMGLLGSSSFGGLLASLLALTFCVIAGRKRRSSARVIIALCITLVILGRFGLIPAIFRDRVLGFLQARDVHAPGSYTVKLDRMLEAIEVIAGQNVLIGLGADGYREIAPLVHNTYLLIWAEGGICAEIGLVLIVISTLWATAAIWRNDSSVGVTSLAVVTVFWLNAATNTHAYGRHSIIPLVLGLLQAAFCCIRPNPYIAP